jgi:8-oxo-dGTP pyrophosphatase MutT (NUDIX family)
MSRRSPVRHSVSVTGVISDNDARALLTRRRDTLHWEPSGGVQELDESIEAGRSWLHLMRDTSASLDVRRTLEICRVVLCFSLVAGEDSGQPVWRMAGVNGI